MNKATLIKSDGSITEIEPKNGSDFSLEELQQLVGGSIEIIPYQDEQVFVVNEEGKLSQLPYNKKATEKLFLAHYTNDYFVGDVLICPTSMIR